MKLMEVNIERLRDLLYEITAISSTPVGCTRLSYSREDKKVREILNREFERLNLEVKVDKLGNIRAKYNPDNLNTPSIMTGSHIDTVRNGGKFDGLLGVVAGLEVINAIDQSNIALRYPIELVIFAEEEGSNFGVTMLGSKYMTNRIDLDYLKQIHNDENKSAYDVIKETGYMANEDYFIHKDDIKCMIEFHIEQGPVLDLEGYSVGVVDRIAGMNTIKVNLIGQSNHAGTTPMKIRKDPMVAAGEMIYRLSEIYKEYNLKNNVITVGKIKARPNNSNVIAANVEFFIDIRDVYYDDQRTALEKVEELYVEIINKYNIEGEFKEIGYSDIVITSDFVKNAVINTAEELGIRYKIMNSGAVHDNAMLNGIVDHGMIFVPSIGGISHDPRENTDFKDIEIGANLLLNTILNINKII